MAALFAISFLAHAQTKAFEAYSVRIWFAYEGTILMDLDLLNVSPSNKPKSNSETGAWLNIAMASKGPDSPPNTSKENWMELE